MNSISPDLQLGTARCVLRALDVIDVPFITASLSDDAFGHALRWDLPRDETALIDAVAASREKWRTGTGYRFTIQLRATMRSVGCIALRHEPRARDWSIGFWIARPHWGQGYAVEAAAAVSEFAFTRLGAIVVRAAHAGRNQQSRRVIEKLGMRFKRQIVDDCGARGARLEFEYALERP